MEKILMHKGQKWGAYTLARDAYEPVETTSVRQQEWEASGSDKTFREYIISLGFVDVEDEFTLLHCLCEQENHIVDEKVFEY